MPMSSEAAAETETVPCTSELPFGYRNGVTGSTSSPVTGSVARAAAASVRPAEVGTQVPAMRWAEVVSAVRIVSADGVGEVEASSAATPETNGVADDVPQNWLTRPLRACAGL